MKGNVIFGLIVGAMIFIPLERLFTLHKDQKIFRAGWLTDALHFIFTNSLSELCLMIVVGLAIFCLRWASSPHFQAAVASQPQALQFLEAFLIANLSGYAGHRLSHEVPFLWRFHAVHHSIVEMDWLAAARVHPLDQIVTKGLTIVPLYLMGFSRGTFGAYIALATLHAVFIHANLKINFGPLRWLFTTPEFHHWHHSDELEARDKNFAGQLPLLDWLFGTLYLPENRRPEKYGSAEPSPPGYLKQMLYPFRRSQNFGRAR